MFLVRDSYRSQKRRFNMVPLVILSPHLHSGGVAAVTADFVSALERKKIPYDIFLMDRMPVSSRWRVHEKNVKFVFNFKTSKYWVIGNAKKILHNLLATYQFLAYFRKSRSVIICVHLAPIFLANLLKFINHDVKIINWYHTDLFAYINSVGRFKKAILKFLFSYVARKADYNIFLHPEFEKGYKKLINDPFLKTSTIVNVFYGDPVEKCFSNGLTRFLVVGRLVKSKRVDLSIRHFASFINSGGRGTLTIAGDGPEMEVLNVLIRDLGISHAVRMMGHVEDVEGLYMDHDVFISFSKFEGFPVAHLEAIRYGLKLISTVSSPNISNLLELNSEQFGKNNFGYFVDVSSIVEMSASEIFDIYSKIKDGGPVPLQRRAEILSNCSETIVLGHWLNIISDLESL